MAAALTTAARFSGLGRLFLPAFSPQGRSMTRATTTLRRLLCRGGLAFAAAAATLSLGLPSAGARGSLYLYGSMTHSWLSPDSWLVYLGAPLAMAVMLVLVYFLGVAAARLIGTRYRDSKVHRTVFVPESISLAFLREKLERGEIGPAEFAEQYRRLVD